MPLSNSLRRALDSVHTHIAEYCPVERRDTLAYDDTMEILEGDDWSATIQEHGPGRVIVHLDIPDIGDATDEAIGVAILRVAIAGHGSGRRPAADPPRTIQE